MKRFFNQSGLLARLLVMITLVIAPILLATLLVANSQYRQNIALIENGRKQLTSSFAVRSAIWLNGGARTLLATYATLAAGRQDNATCSASIMAAILANSDYRAALATLPDGRICLGSTEPSLTQQDLERIAALETGVASAAPLTKPEGAVPNYETLIWNGRPLVLIRLSVPAKHGPGGTALLLADGDAIETIFDSPRPGEAEFALIHRDGAMIARRALPDSGEDWLPADPPVLTGYSRFSGLDRSGSKAEFAMMPVAGTPFAVATRLSTHRTDEAWRQYVIMTVAPIIVAFMLLAAYVTGLKRDVLRWIMGLKGAARSRIEDPQSEHLAPVGDDMPMELRTMVDAFNQMVHQTNRREDDLRHALDHNQFLMRELHHRVKNSLQVIRSYLALSQRSATSAEKRRDIAGTEARVLVLAVAYRMALTDEGMRPVALSPFVEEVVGSLSTILRRPTQEVTTRVDVAAGLEVDRAIPLGLAIVESLIIAFGADACSQATVEIAAVDRSLIDLIVRADLAEASAIPDQRIMRGLALQLQATPQEIAPGETLHWRFAAD